MSRGRAARISRALAWPGRRGRPLRLLSARLLDPAGQLGRCGQRAAGLGHAARQPAAARLVTVRRVLLHHRTAAVRPAGTGAGPRPRSGPRGRGDDLHPGRAAHGPPRCWPGGATPRNPPRIAGEGRRSVSPPGTGAPGGSGARWSRPGSCSRRSRATGRTCCCCPRTTWAARSRSWPPCSCSTVLARGATPRTPPAFRLVAQPPGTPRLRLGGTPRPPASPANCSGGAGGRAAHPRPGRRPGGGLHRGGPAAGRLRGAELPGRHHAAAALGQPALPAGGGGGRDRSAGGCRC